MTRNETKQILMFLVSAYPNFHPENPAFTIDSWTLILENEDAKAIKEAALIYTRTCTSGFAPSPAQLIEIAHRGDVNISEEEAVSMIRNAASRGIYHASEEYALLPETVQKTIGSPRALHRWAECPAEVFECSVVPQIRKNFRTMVNREKEDRIRLKITKKREDRQIAETESA